MKKLLTLAVLLLSFQVCAQNINVSEGTIFEGEPYLAINPTNPQHQIVAWMGWTNFINQFQIKTRVTFDGGLNWSPIVNLPHLSPGYTSADPSIAFAPNGKLYVSYIDFTGTQPPVTGGVYLAKSEDGGLSFEPPTAVITTDFDGSQWPVDRPWMVIDNSQGPHSGNIYITSFNLNRESPPFRPYLSVSNDGGVTFTTNYVDDNGWLAGNLNPLPMCSPAIASNGTFYGSYPSLNFTQSIFPQFLLATSIDGGQNFSYSTIATITDTPVPNAEEAKKGGILICNPADSDHLATVGLRTTFGDLDVFLAESFDGGQLWGAPVRINDDPIANNRMQDLVWADFDTNGDLIVSWRDRRNGNDSIYQTTTEIWAAFRHRDSSEFSPNFKISSEAAAHDEVLESAGNDFMCTALHQDTLYAVWGDTRSGILNIWYQKMTTAGQIISSQVIAVDNRPEIIVYPNPVTELVNIEGKNLKLMVIYDQLGRQLLQKKLVTGSRNATMDLSTLSKGVYNLKIVTNTGQITTQLLKE